MTENGEKLPDTIIFNEVQTILAEKRTSLAMMRTGIAVFAIPLSIFSFLIVTSNYYHISRVWPLLLPVIVINLGLIILGSYLILRSLLRIRRFDRSIQQLKKKHGILAELME